MQVIILRVLALLATIARPLTVWLKTGWGKFLASSIGVWFASQMGLTAIKAVIRAGVVVAVMGAYGTLLEVFWTYAAGTSLRDIFNAQPFSGCPAGVLYLVSHAFPLKFMVGTMFAYIHWRFSVIVMGIWFSRVVRALSGA